MTADLSISTGELVAGKAALGDLVRYSDMANPGTTFEVIAVPGPADFGQYQLRWVAGVEWSMPRGYESSDLRQRGWTFVQRIAPRVSSPVGDGRSVDVIQIAGGSEVAMVQADGSESVVAVFNCTKGHPESEAVAHQQALRHQYHLIRGIKIDAAWTGRTGASAAAVCDHYVGCEHDR